MALKKKMPTTGKKPTAKTVQVPAHSGLSNTASNPGTYWPMFQQNIQRTGCITARVSASYIQGFSPVQLSAPIFGSVTCDRGDNLYVCSLGPNGSVSCISPVGSVLWNYQTSMVIGSGAPLMDDAGVLYVAGTALVALSSATTPPLPAFQSYTFASGATCNQPLGISPDGKTIYAILSVSGASSVIALTIPTSPGGTFTQLWNTPLLNGQSQPMTANGALCLGTDGTIYLGDISGNLFSINPADGVLTLLHNFVFPITTPVMGPDGTLHVMSVDPTNTMTQLISFKAGQNSFTFAPSRPISKKIIASPQSIPAIDSSGNIYIGFDTLYKLTWNPNIGYVQVWKTDTTSVRGIQPINLMCDGANTITYSCANNYLVSVNSSGVLQWNQLSGALGSAPAIGSSGAVYFIDGSTVKSCAASGSLILATINSELISASTSGPGNTRVYSINATSIPNTSVFTLVTGALGATPNTVTGTLTFTGMQLTLNGTSSFYGVTSAGITLTFTSQTNNGVETISLATQATCGTSVVLSSVFAGLMNSIFDTLSISSAVFSQNTSTATANTNWALTGQTTFAGPLADVAKLIGTAPTSLQLSGTIITSSGLPIVMLSTGSTFSMKIANSWNLPLNISIQSMYDDASKAFASFVGVSTTLTVDSQSVVISAQIPVNGGIVVFEADFVPVASLSSIANMIFWPGANVVQLSAALPPQVSSQTTFGLKTIRMAVNPSSLSLVSATMIFGANGYEAFSAASIGVPLQVSNVEVFASVADPLGTPEYQVGVSGQVSIGTTNPVVFDVAITAPDWIITGVSQQGSSVSPLQAITLLGGNQSLPTTAPTNPFGDISFSAMPTLGIYNFSFSSDQTWTLFTAGSFTAAIGNFSLSVDRFIANPTTNTGVISVQVEGQLILADSAFVIGAYVPSDGNWSFYANLANSTNLPSILDILNAISAGYANNLPAPIANLGRAIVLNQLEINLSNAGPQSIVVGVGSAPGWTGWSVFTTPFSFTLLNASVIMTAQTGATNSVTALIQAVFSFGTGNGDPGLLVQVPLPISSGNMVFNLVPGEFGLQLPTVAQVLALVNQSWATQLPPQIASIGSNIAVTKFCVTVIQTPTAKTTLDFTVGAIDPTAKWSPLGIESFALSGLGVGGTVTASPLVASGYITGTVQIGEHGYIPLIASMENNLSSFTIQLDSSKGTATLPTVGDIIGIFSSSWASALPSQVTSVGQNMALQTFKLQHTSSSDTAQVAIGSPPTWSLPISDFLGLALTSYSVSLNYDRTATSPWSGGLNIAGTIFSEPVTISATMPDLTFSATMNPTNFNMQTLVQGFIGSPAPDWLKEIGFDSISMTVKFSPVNVSIQAVQSSIDLPPLCGHLENVGVSASFGGSSNVSVCLIGTWVPPIGPKIPGTFCYPFNTFKPQYNPSRTFNNFPKPRPTNLSPASAASSAAIAGDIGAYIAAGFGVALGTAFAVGIYNDNDDDSACVAGAFQYLGNTPTQEQLADIVRALAKNFSNDPIAIAKALYSGATFQGVTLSQQQVALAIQQGLTDTTAALVAKSILGVYPSTLPTLMVTILAGSGFAATDIAPVLPFIYPIGGTNPACTTISQICTALTSGITTATAPQIVSGLFAAGFGAAETTPIIVATYPTATSTAALMLTLLEGAGYSASAAAQALYTSYASSGCATASLMSNVLFATYPATTGASMLSILAGLPYPAGDVVVALKSTYPTAYSTASLLTTLMATATPSYTPNNIANALLKTYSTVSWKTSTDLLNALIAGWPTISSASAMLALESATFGPIDSAAAFQSLAPTKWPTENNVQGLATALAAGNYGSSAVLVTITVLYPTSVTTALAACTIMKATNIINKEAATAALLAAAFTVADTNAAVTQIYR